MGQQDSGALNGVRVVDFGQYVAGPLVAQLLADYGADVIRVDPPGGPVWKHESNAILQRGKRSIVLDLKTDADRDIARRLIDSADVVIENFRPGVMERLGLGPEDALARHPRLIYTSIPGYASDDPRSSVYASEGVVAATAALYPPHDQNWDAEPVVNTLPLASVSGALVAANSVAAALIARERGGLGQHVEVSLFDASYELSRVYIDSPPGGHVHAPAHGFGGSFQIPIARSYECADGRWIRLTWLEGRQIEDFARSVGKYDEWKALGFYEVGPKRVFDNPDLSEKMNAEISAAFLTRDADYWEREFGLDADLSVIRTSKDWLLYDEQAKAIDGSIELIDPELGVTRQGGSPVTMTATPAAHTPRHELGADRAGILAELEQLEATPTTVPSGEVVDFNAALDGIRAVDTTVLLAGPTACRLLAEYGAEVVHVGNANWRGMDNFHYQVHGGKRTVLIDLKTAEGKEVFRDLVKDADVLSTNFAQSVGRRLGVGEDAVREYNPDIIYSRISAHGVFGPRAEYRGHEEIGQAATGALYRFSNTPAGNMQFMLINDDGTGHVAAFGIMVALFHRLRTGVAQFVGSSLAQTCVTWQTPFMIDHRTKDWNEPGGLDFRGYGPLEHVYQGSDNRWLYLSVAPAAGVTALASIAGLEGIDNTETSELHSELAARFATAPAQQWIDALNAAAGKGIGAGLLTKPVEAMVDDWAVAHGLVQQVHLPGVGDGRLVGPAPRLSRTPMQMGKLVNPPGADTRTVLAEYGWGDRVDELIEKGVVKEPATEPLNA